MMGKIRVQKGRNRQMKKILFFLGITGMTLSLYGCKKETVHLETTENIQTNTDMEEYKDENQIDFPVVNETIYDENKHDVPADLSGTIWTEATNYLTEFTQAVFTYHGETDFTQRLLPYFGEQGKFEYHDYDFPELLAKEYSRKNIDITYQNIFISGMYLQHYDPDGGQYVISFSAYATTEMQTKTIERGIYCNTIHGILLYTDNHWEIAQYSLDYVRTSPCEVRCVDAEHGTFRYMGDIIEIWDVDNAYLEQPEIPSETEYITDDCIIYDGDANGITTSD